MGNFYSQAIKSNRYAPLSPDEEKKLAHRIKVNDHDREARNRLVCGSVRFVVQVAARYQQAGLSMDDLIQEGNSGLIHAAGRFDGERNFKFVSYAIWWIRRYILFALNEHGRIVKVPQHSGALGVKVKAATAQLEQRYQREPTDEEIARDIEIDEKWIQVLRNTNNSVSLNTMTGNEDYCPEIIDNLTYDEEESKIDEQAVVGLLKKLSGRELDYVKRYYMDEWKPDLQDIGNKANLSRERVRQIIDNGIKKLRRTAKKELVYA